MSCIVEFQRTVQGLLLLHKSHEVTGQLQKSAKVQKHESATNSEEDGGVINFKKSQNDGMVDTIQQRNVKFFDCKNNQETEPTILKCEDPERTRFKGRVHKALKVEIQVNNVNKSWILDFRNKGTQSEASRLSSVYIKTSLALCPCVHHDQRHGV